MTRVVMLCVLAGLAVAPVVAQTPKYGVTVKTDEKTDFSKFKTYTWEHGWQAYDKTVNAEILAAIDRELAGVGLTKKASGPSDVIVTYASLRRIDVDTNSRQEVDGMRRQYDVGSLVVLLLEPGSRKELFRGRVDQPIEMDSPEKVKAAIDSATAEMFAKYPRRK